MWKAFFVCFVITTLIFLTDCTICKPRSEFHMDCNICRCSQSGREYSCTHNRCPPVDYSEFVTEIYKGHIVLKPKQKGSTSNQVLTRKSRRVPIPYVNDEIYLPQNKYPE